MSYRDLTQPVRDGMLVFPGDPKVTLDRHATVAADGYQVHTLNCGSHTGTHVDAPSHFLSDGEHIDTFPTERFVLDAILADCSGRQRREPIGPESLPASDADVVVVRTDWSDHWDDQQYLEHPYLTPAAAEFCVEQGYDVAIDTLNPDPTPTERADSTEPSGFPVHRQLLSERLLIFENLTGLSELPDRFELVAFPLKLANSDGAPVRAVARLD
ncbi:cyclase family protein [Haloarcula halophila]|uniref:cyclase family protein n=1 Tax=Haloarcula TaxID=2237 RepID=UPI0023E46E34|nr:cyclase family protein [Halomicroarcula sp. DFY41]